MCVSGEASRAGEAGAGSGQSFGGAGRTREARAGGRQTRQSGGVPAASALSGLGRLGPAAPGRALRETRAPWLPDVGPWSTPKTSLPPGSSLFPTPGFQAEFGEAVWAKTTTKDDS